MQTAHFGLMACVPVRMYHWYIYDPVLNQRSKLHSFETTSIRLNFLGIGSSGQMYTFVRIEVRIDLKKVYPTIILTKQ